MNTYKVGDCVQAYIGHANEIVEGRITAIERHKGRAIYCLDNGRFVYPRQVWGAISLVLETQTGEISEVVKVFPENLGHYSKPFIIVQDARGVRSRVTTKHFMANLKANHPTNVGEFL